MPVIDRLGVGDYDEAISFLNRVFSVRSPHDTQRLLPALYQRDDAMMRCNYAIRLDGHLAAMAGVFPIEWQVGDVTLRIAGIGGVATERSLVGAGLIDELLNQIVADLKSNDYHLALLNGQRLRYGTFGFARAGSEMVYDVTARDVVSDGISERIAPISLVPMSDEAVVLEMVREWHERQVDFCRRPPHRFYAYLNNWRNMAWLAEDEVGQFVGYVVGSEDGGPTPEIVGNTPEAAVRIAQARIVQCKRPVSVTASSLASPVARYLNQVAEAVTVRTSGLWQVFDWVTVTDALLRVRMLSEALPPGRVTICIEDADETFTLYVEGENAGCIAESCTPTISLSAGQALRLLFGPASPANIVDLPGAAAVLQAWCPLPLAIPRLDHV